MIVEDTGGGVAGEGTSGTGGRRTTETGDEGTTETGGKGTSGTGGNRTTRTRGERTTRTGGEIIKRVHSTRNASDKAYQLLAHGRGSLWVLRLHPTLKLVAMIF